MRGFSNCSWILGICKLHSIWPLSNVRTSVIHSLPPLSYGPLCISAGLPPLSYGPLCISAGLPTLPYGPVYRCEPSIKYWRKTGRVLGIYKWPINEVALDHHKHVHVPFLASHERWPNQSTDCKWTIVHSTPEGSHRVNDGRHTLKHTPFRSSKWFPALFHYTIEVKSFIRSLGIQIFTY